MLKKAQKLILAVLMSVSFTAAQSTLDSLITTQQLGASYGANITSFSLAGLGMDGSNSAVDIFRIDFYNKTATPLSGLQLRVTVKLNGNEIYRAISSTFSLAANGGTLPVLMSSDFFTRDKSHDAEGYTTEFKLDEEGIKQLGITNLISSPAGNISMTAQIVQGSASSTPVDLLSMNIVTVPEVTILGPRGTLVEGVAPWFRWQSVLDGLVPDGDKRYYLNIYGPNGFSGTTITGDPIYSAPLMDNNLLYPVSEAPQLVPGELYAWQVVAVRSGPQNQGEDLSLKSELATFGYPSEDGSPPSGGGGDENPPAPPADPAEQEAAITAAMNQIEDMINGLKDGETFDPAAFNDAMDNLNQHFDTDITLDGESVRIYEAAAMINRMIGGGYGDVSVSIQVDAGENGTQTESTSGNGETENGDETDPVPVLTFPEDGFILKAD